jgi:hypothetical protein
MSRVVKGVLLDQDLLAYVWGFVLGGHGRQDVRVLGQLSLVCRKWREAGAWDGWWRAVEEDMLPLLWGKEERGKAASSRGRVVEYGRFLEGERDPLTRQEPGDSWLEGLEGHVEIFDRMDGLQMLSMRGPVSFHLYDGPISMEFRAESPGMQVKAAAFSAASRDPLRRFLTMEGYLVKGHKERYPCRLCIRVTLRDTRTGRTALIWEDNKQCVDHFETSDDEGGLRVYGGRWRCQKNRFGKLLRTNGAYFEVNPVPDQGEDVGEQDVLYTFKPSQFEVMFRSMTDYGGRVVSYDDDYLTMEHFEGILQAVLG